MPFLFAPLEKCNPSVPERTGPAEQQVLPVYPKGLDLLNNSDEQLTVVTRKGSFCSQETGAVLLTSFDYEAIRSSRAFSVGKHTCHFLESTDQHGRARVTESLTGAMTQKARYIKRKQGQHLLEEPPIIINRFQPYIRGQACTAFMHKKL